MWYDMKRHEKVIELCIIIYAAVGGTKMNELQN